MSTLNINIKKGVYACGHEGTVKISGCKAADREWKASKAFEHDCPECI